VEAAAVTEEVSFIAVPENIPKASPLRVSKPIILPKTGKRSAANTLKKKITDMACATSSSSAFITGAVAAMAEPPHMEEPTPTRVEILPGIFISLCKIKAIISAVDIVQMIIGSDCLPVWSTTFRLRPNPRKTTAACKTYFEVNFIPLPAMPLSFQTRVIIIPAIIAITGPPIIGNLFPRNQAGRAMRKHTSIPIRFFDKKDFIEFILMSFLNFIV
jgi:hypothetical protein